MFTTDQYSDYYVMGVFRATQTIDHAALYDEYLQERPDQARQPGSPYEGKIGWKFEPPQFLGWLSRRGLLEPIDCYEWNLEFAKIEAVENLAPDKES